MNWKKYDIYNTYDKPIPYKDLLFYPVVMTEYVYFFYFSEILTIDKNSLNDPKAISMKYFDYLFNMSDDKTMYIAKFDGLLKLCLNKKDAIIKYGLDQNKHAVFQIDEHLYNWEDFEEIKKIITEQNLVEVPDESISKPLRDSLKRARDYKASVSGNKIGTLEDQIICVLISTSLSLEDIYKLSIRKFSKILQRVDHKLHYQIYLSASMSGFVEFKDKSILKHWMSDLNKDNPFDDVETDLDSVKNKVNFSDKMTKK